MVFSQVRRKFRLYSLGGGQFFKVLFKPRIKIGIGFQANHHLNISGPGRVIIGRRVQFLVNCLEQVKIVTLTPDAIVKIGDFCVLGGTTIICSKSIEIGRNCLLANAKIMDVDFQNDFCPRPVLVGDRCWIAQQTSIQKGVTFGSGSVLSLGSCIRNKIVSENFLCMGNPARPVFKIQS